MAKIISRFDSHELEIAVGAAGYSWVDIFGQNPDVDTAAAEDIWANGGDYTFITTAETMSTVSDSLDDESSGTGAQTLTIEGLDADYNALTETISLAGLCTVATTGTFLRVNKFYVASAGSGGQNAGVITVQGTNSATVLGSIAAGDNQSLLSIYTIPANKTGYVRRIYGNVDRSKAAFLRFLYRVENGVWRILREIDVNSRHVAVDLHYASPPMPEKTDLKIRAISANTNNTVVAAGCNILLIDD